MPELQQMNPAPAATGTAVDDGENSYVLVSALFVRLLAVVYFIAFASLSGQILALAGHDGILPVTTLLENAGERFGWERFLAYPTVFWIHAGDVALKGATWLGCAFAVFAFLNYRSRFSLVMLFLLYLSLYHAGQIFMNFQWDYLLLEAGFLAIFLRPDARIVIFLFRWLLFRLRFLSGLSKVLSQDASWASLSALTFYFETQPLPHAGAWYAHHLPLWILILGAAFTLFVELVVPFMMFMTRKLRFIAAWLTLSLQVLIMLTSNHNWFNILTIVLCLFLFDDKALRRVLPARVGGWLTGQAVHGQAGALEKILTSAVAVMILLFSSIQMFEMVRQKDVGGWPGQATAWVHRWVIANRYHVFPTIERRRIEMIIEGTADGVHWEPYRFRYKPGALDKPLSVVIPHHPRIDWMMWFVQIDPVFSHWFEEFLYALMNNAPSITSQLEYNPFADSPPAAIRVRAYEYAFTTPQEKAATGNWWKRKYLGPFDPVPGLTRNPES